jgi:hypothetical protein
MKRRTRYNRHKNKHLRRIMRIVCPHCGGRAVIDRGRKDITPTISDLYCSCKSIDCGARFVFQLSYKHTTNPPVEVTVQLAAAVIKALPPGQRAQLGDLFAQP